MAMPKFVGDAARQIAKIPVVGPALRKMVGGRLHVKFRMQHPYDKKYGVVTSDFVTADNLGVGQEFKGKINPYGPVQPSIMRQLIALLPKNLQDYSFIDLGCGLGRANLIATEYPFQHNIGIEISPRLTRVAEKNAEVMKKNHPARTPIQFIEGNAIAFPIPSRKLVIFVYNSFGDELMRELLKNMEKGLEKDIDHLLLVSHNPVTAHVFDASPALKRWYVGQLVCDPAELSFGYNQEGATIIWQSVKGALPTPHANTDRQIIVKGHDGTTLA